jgi:hypothetical protein
MARGDIKSVWEEVILREISYLHIPLRIEDILYYGKMYTVEGIVTHGERGRSLRDVWSMLFFPIEFGFPAVYNKSDGQALREGVLEWMLQRDSVIGEFMAWEKLNIASLPIMQELKPHILNSSVGYYGTERSVEFSYVISWTDIVNLRIYPQGVVYGER